MDDVYGNIDDYDLNRQRKILIVFDDMTADMTNKKSQVIIKELFIRCGKLNVSLVFITQSLFFCYKRDTLFGYENQQRKKIRKYCN